MRADGPGPGSVWLNDPQVAANHFAVEAEHARFGDMLRWGPLVTVGGHAKCYGPGPLCGEHTDATLRDLGRSDEQIRALRDARVVGSETV